MQTNASSDEFGEVVQEPVRERVKIRIAAAPLEGKANKHLIKFLTKEFRVPKSSISILAGEKCVRKRLKIERPSRLPDKLKIETFPKADFMRWCREI